MRNSILKQQAWASRQTCSIVGRCCHDITTSVTGLAEPLGSTESGDAGTIAEDQLVLAWQKVPWLVKAIQVLGLGFRV